MIYTAPGASFEATADWDTTGLVGTITVAVYDGIGGTSVAPTTSGIVEVATGVYVATITAPNTAGQYSVVWTDGIDTASDELTVTSSTSTPVGVVGAGINYGDMIDLVLDRFDEVSRTRAGQAINNRYQHLWDLEDWTFKFTKVTVTVTGSTQAVGGLPTDMGVPVYLWDENGEKLIYLEQGDFYTRYLDEDPADPEAWTVVDQSILLGPTPNASATYSLYYRKRLTELTDESDVPDWPNGYRLAIVHAAGVELRGSYYDPTGDDLRQLVNEDLDAMRREYLTDAVGQPDRWPSDEHLLGYGYGY